MGFRVLICALTPLLCGSLAVAGEEDSFGVAVFGAGSHLEFRTAGEPWELVPVVSSRMGLMGSFGLNIGELPASVDLRLDSEPWFSSHVLQPEWFSPKGELLITLGERLNGFQSVTYSGFPSAVSVPVTAIPEPKAWAVAIFGFLGVAGFRRAQEFAAATPGLW